MLTILTLLFLTGLFEDLPEATLGAVVIAALIELVDISALRALGWEPQRTPADSVAAYAEWLKGLDGLDGVLAEADARMRALGVVRKAGV